MQTGFAFLKGVKGLVGMQNAFADPGHLEIEIIRGILDNNYHI
jgi:hypothetical protein